jgi:hypothetical protein
MNGYQDIAHAILARIHSGELRPARNCCRYARRRRLVLRWQRQCVPHAWLEQQGLVVAERGRGTFVRDQAPAVTMRWCKRPARRPLST